MKSGSFVGLSAPVLCLVFALVGCASTGGDRPSELYRDGACSEGLYYARSPAMQTAERELAECLFRVAGQISIQRRVTVEYAESPANAPDGSPLTRAQVSIDYDQSNSIAILDRLTVRKVARTGNGTEVLVKAGSIPGVRVFSVQVTDRVGSDGNPVWVNRPPKGSGYVSAVGMMSQGHASADGYSYADTNAIGSLARLVAKPQPSGSSTVYRATLSGVFIARRWYNSREGRWYSLAILPKR